MGKRGVMHMLMQVNEFSYGPVTPALGFAMSFLGAFLGLRCAARARANDSWARRWWLVLAGVSLGLSCVWVGHFIDMLGFAVPGGTVLYDVPDTLASAFLAVAAMCAGLFVTGRGRQLGRLVLGGLVVGLGIASMHYVGMAAMRMSAQPMAMAVHGATALGFLLPLILVTSILTYILTFIIAIAPSEDELREDATLQVRIAELNRRLSDRAR